MRWTAQRKNGGAQVGMEIRAGLSWCMPPRPVLPGGMVMDYLSQIRNVPSVCRPEGMLEEGTEGTRVLDVETRGAHCLLLSAANIASQSNSPTVQQSNSPTV